MSEHTRSATDIRSCALLQSCTLEKQDRHSLSTSPVSYSTVQLQETWIEGLRSGLVINCD